MTGNKQEVLRDLQLAEKQILMDVVDVCDRNNIMYYLSSGTLLGAVRHQGFIPWDDDIDIEIPIDDYYRFLEIAQKELGDEYFVQTSMTDPNYHFAYTRIRKNNTTFLNPYDLTYKVHHGIWLDVFPLVAVNPGLPLQIERKIISLSNFVQIGEKINTHKPEFQRMLGPVGMAVMNVFSKLPMKTRQKIHNLILKPIYNANPDKCTHRANIWGNITTYFPKEVYEGEPQELCFEGTMFKVPHDYKRYLEIKYGDYMKLPPEDQRTGHGVNIIIDLDNSYEKYMKL